MSRPAPFLILTDGHQTGDCTIIALTSLTGLPYSKVLSAACQVAPEPDTRGMYNTEIMATAKRLGFPLEMKRKWNMKTAEGILNLGSRKKRNGKSQSGHCVVLSHGLIFEGTDVWEPDDYFKRNPRYIPRSIM